MLSLQFVVLPPPGQTNVIYAGLIAPDALLPLSSETMVKLSISLPEQFKSQLKRQSKLHWLIYIRLMNFSQPGDQKGVLIDVLLMIYKALNVYY